MNSLAPGMLLVTVAYFVGSIPFGFLCGKLVKGIDIRQHGSGNVGATNVGRVLGWKWGVFVLLLDLFKGLIPVGVIAPWLIGEEESLLHWQVAAGVATVLGHMFPCWLKFNAGKGVATALGVIIVLGGWSTPVAAGTFAATFGLWRIVSLSSMLAATAFGICQMIRLWPEPFSAQNWSLGAFSVLMPLLIILRHRTNIARLWRGEEQRYAPRERGG